MTKDFMLARMVNRCFLFLVQLGCLMLDKKGCEFYILSEEMRNIF